VESDWVFYAKEISRLNKILYKRKPIENWVYIAFLYWLEGVLLIGALIK